MNNNSNRQLLVQTFPFTMPSKDSIRQSIKRADGKMFLTGLLQCANKENGNGRQYPREILQREIAKYQQKIKRKTSFGECDHPDSDAISLKNIALLITQIHWQGDNVVGTIMLTSNSIGRDMQALVQDGASLSISSRGMGSLKHVGNKDIVQEDFELVGWDLVSQPSTEDATFWNDQAIKQSAGRNANKFSSVSTNGALTTLVQQVLSTLNRES